MRVVILSSRFHPQLVGSGTSAYIMAKGLAERGHEVTVITDDSVRPLAVNLKFPFKTVYITDLEKYSRGTASFKVPTEMTYEAIKEARADIIHVCNFMPMLMITNARNLFKAPIIFTFYNTPIESKRAIGYYENSDLDMALARSIIQTQAYDLLFLGSQCYYDAALSLGAQPSKIVLSRLGVEHIRATITDKDKRALFTRYIDTELTEENKLIMLPGRVVRQKGTLEAVEALARLSPNHRLLITGMANPFDATFASQVIEAARRSGVLDRIIIPKKVIDHDHLCVFYDRADVVITPSYYEGLGLAAIEALSAGCALVATDAPGLNEVVEDGVNGLVVKVADVQALADAIEIILSNPGIARKLALNGPAITNKFSLPKHLDELEHTYKRILKDISWNTSRELSPQADLAHV